MSSVDNRIVNMEFNNEQFEYGVKESIDSLNNLEKSLQLKDATIGIDKATKAVQNFDISRIASSVDDLNSRFSAVGVAGMTMINKLTSGFLDFGVRTVKALTLDPVLAGFNELETQNKSIQTILSNTSRRYGTTIDDVRGKLDELNTYADKTIYNFTQMTDNIGKFTAAGVDLDQSVSAIKGLSNLGAFMGTNATAVSGAMYQMSQAMATGAVKMLDWRSMELRGMAGTEFQEDIIRTARAMGVAVDEAMEKYGGFRESLRAGWLTNEVFLESLSHFATDVNEIGEDVYREQLRAKGYTDDDIQAIMYLGSKATEAATKVKSWSQLWDTLGEEAGSSWTKTWDLILGGYEGAENLFNGAYQMLKPFVEGLGEMRNFVVQDLVHTGSIKAIILGLTNIAKIGQDVFNTFSKSFTDNMILGQVQKFLETGTWDDASHIGKVLSRVAWAFERFTKSIQFSESDLSSLSSIFDGINSLLIFGLDILTVGITTAFDVASAFSPLISVLLDIGGAIGDVITYLKDAWLAFGVTDNIITVIKNLLVPVKEATQLFADFVHGVFDVAGAIAEKLLPGLDFFRNLNFFGGIIDFTKGLADGSKTFFDSIRQFGTSFTTDLIGKIKSGHSVFSTFFDYVNQGFNNVKNTVSDTARKIGDAFGKSQVGQQWAQSFSGLNDTIQNEFKQTPVTFKSVFDVCKEAVKGFLNFLKTVFTTQFPNLAKKLGDVFKNLPQHISNFFSKVKEFFTGSGDGASMGSFIDVMREKLAQFIEYLRDKRLLFTDKFADFFKSAYERIREVIPRLTDAIGGFLDSVGQAMGIENMASNVTIFDKIGAIFAAAVARLKELMGPVIEELGSIGAQIQTAFTEFVKGAFGSVQDIPWGDLAIIASLLALTKTLTSLAGVFKAVKGPVAKVEEVLGSVKGLFDQLKLLGEAVTKNVKWAFLTAFVKELPAVLGALAALAAIAVVNPEAVLTATLSLIGVIGALIGLMERLNGMPVPEGGFAQAVNVGAMTGPILAIAAATWVISGAVAKLGRLNPNEIIWGLGAVAGIFAALMSAMTLMSTASANVTPTGVSRFDPSRFVNGGSFLLMLLGLSASIKIISDVVKEIGDTNPNEIEQGLNAVSRIILALGLTTAVFAKASSSFQGKGQGSALGLAATVVGLSLAIKAITDSIKLLGRLDTGQLDQGLRAITDIMLAIGAMSAISSLGGGGGANFGWMAAFALSLVPLIWAFKSLCQVDIASMGTGLLGLAGVLTTLGVASYVLAPMADGMDRVANVMIKFAAAAALIGVAIFAVAELVHVLSTLGTALNDTDWAAGAVGFITDLLGVITGSAGAVAQALVDLLVIGLETVGNNIGRIVEAFANVLVTAIKAVTQYIPEIVSAFVDLWNTIWDSVTAEIGKTAAERGPAAAIADVLLPILTTFAAKEFGKMKWGDIAKMIIGFAGVLVPLAACIALINQTSNEYSAGTLAAVDGMVACVGGLIGVFSKFNIKPIDPGTAFHLAADIDIIVGMLEGLVAASGLIGNIVDMFFGEGTTLDMMTKGAAMIGKIGEAIGNVIGGLGGAIVGNFEGTLDETKSNHLPSIGKNLNEFAKNCGDFFDYFDKIDDGYVQRISNYGDAMSKMGAALGDIDFGTNFETNMSDLGTSFGDLGGKLKEFDDAVGDADAGKFKQTAEGLKTFAELTKILPTAVGDVESVHEANWGRQQTLAEFASDISAFVTSIKSGVNELGGAGDLDLSGLSEAVTFAKDVVALANDLPDNYNENSVPAFWTGRRMQLGEFVEGLGGLLGTVAEYKDQFKTAEGLPDTLEGLNNVMAFANQAKDLANQLPEAQSFKGLVFGGTKQSLSAWVEDFASFALRISGIDWSFLGKLPDLSEGSKLDNLAVLLGKFTTASQQIGTVWSEAGLNLNPFDPNRGFGIYFRNADTISKWASDFKEASTPLIETFSSINDALNGVGATGPMRQPLDLDKLQTFANCIQTLSDAQKLLSEAQLNYTTANSNPGWKNETVDNLAAFANTLAHGVEGDANTPSLFSSMQTISNDMANFDAPNLSKLESVTGSIKNLAGAYQAIVGVTLPDGEYANADISDKVGVLKDMAIDAQQMIGPLSDLANAFSESGGSDLPSMNNLERGVGAIKTLAEAYNTLLTPFYREDTLDTVGTKRINKGIDTSGMTEVLDGFTNSIPKLATGLRNFTNGLNGIDGTNVKAFDQAAFDTAIDNMGKLRDFYQEISGVSGGADALDFSEDGPLSGFIEAIPDLGKNLSEFSQNMGDFQSENYGKMLLGVDAAKKVLELKSDLKDFNLGDAMNFGNSLGQIGTGLADLSRNLGEDFNADNVTNAMPALEAMVTSLNGITVDDTLVTKAEKLGGVVQQLVGAFTDDSLGNGTDKAFKEAGSKVTAWSGDADTFGQRFTTVSENIGIFADGINTLNGALAGIPEIQTGEGSNVSNFAKAITDIIDAFNFETTVDQGEGHVGEIQGSITKITGNMTAMGTALQQLSDAFNMFQGTGGVEGGGAVGAIQQLKDFITQLQEADLPTITANMTSLSEAIQKLAGIGGGGGGLGLSQGGANPFGDLPGANTGGGGLQGVMDLITTLGSTDISGAATSIQTISTALTSLTGVGGDGGGVAALKDAVEQLSTIDWSVATSGVTSFQQAFSQMAASVSASASTVVSACTNMVTQCVSALNNLASQFQTAGTVAATRYAAGISGSSAPSSAATAMAHAAAFAAQSNSYSGFYSAGVMAASGMAAGIRSAASQVASEAANMVKDAIAAAKAAQASASPSREFMKIGGWAAQGYMMGMASEKVHVAKTTSDVIGKAIQSAYNMATNDLTLKPVIEPVIDLNQAQQDAATLNQMLEASRANSLVKAVGSAAAISKRIKDNQEIQNSMAEEPAVATVNNTFTQNITSPKAVSRMEVYRDTRNLFALEKGNAIKEKGVTIR